MASAALVGACPAVQSAQIESDIVHRFCVGKGLRAAGMKTISIPWFTPEFGGAVEQERLCAVLASNYVNDGAVAREFEQRIAELIGVKHCVAVTSGTAAISLALLAIGIEPGDEVLVPDLTFVATANAARMIGAEVKLVDVEPRRFAIDVDKAARAVGPRTRAIVPVDVNGRGADYNALQSLAQEKGLKIVCDSAEALGSKYCGRPLGTFGDAACFSFSPNKTISSGQGGIIATNSDGIHSRLRELKDQGRRHGGTGGDDLHPVMGFNFKYTNLQAALGLAQLERFRGARRAFRRARRLVPRVAVGLPWHCCSPTSQLGRRDLAMGRHSMHRPPAITSRAARGGNRRPPILVSASSPGAVQSRRLGFSSRDRHLRSGTLAAVRILIDTLAGRAGRTSGARYYENGVG